MPPELTALLVGPLWNDPEQTVQHPDPYVAQLLTSTSPSIVTARCFGISVKGRTLAQPPPIVPPVEGWPADEPDVFTDGYLTGSTWLPMAFAGAGLWLSPECDVPSWQEESLIHDFAHFEHHRPELMWAPVHGQESSSSRSELMALTLALLIPRPIHIALDSMTVSNA